MQEDLSKYYIKYICDLIRTFNPDQISKASELVVVSTLDSQAKSSMNHFLEKFNDLVYFKQNRQQVAEGVPYFFKTSSGGSEKVIANFGEYFTRDPEEIKTSRQSMLNILYTFKLAKKIKIIFAIDSELIRRCDSKVVQIFKHLSTTFTDLMIQKHEKELSERMIKEIKNCIGIMVTKSQEEDELQIEPLLEKLIHIAKNQDLKRDSAIGFSALQNLIKNKRIILESDSYANILNKIEDLPSFKFDRNILKAYFSYNIQVVTTELQKKRKQAVLKGIGLFKQIVNGIMKKILQNLDLILSDNTEKVSELNKALESNIAELANGIRDLNVPIKLDVDPELIIVVGDIFMNMTNLLEQFDAHSCTANEISLPWQIISIIYRSSLINQKKTLNQSSLFMLGYLCKMSFKVFSYFREFNQMNDEVLQNIPLFYQIALNRFTIILHEWADGTCHHCSPKVLRKVMQKLEQIIKLLKQVLSHPSKQLANHIDHLETAKLYLKIDLLKIKHQYLKRMRNNLTVDEKITQIQKIHQLFTDTKQHLEAAYAEGSKELLKMIYEILGDELAKHSSYYFSLEAYEHGALLHKMRNLSIQILEETMEKITQERFFKIMKILMRLGMTEEARKYSYIYLQGISSEEDAIKVKQFLFETAEIELKVEKLDFMTYFSTDGFNKPTLMKEQLLIKSIQALRQLEDQALIYKNYLI